MASFEEGIKQGSEQLKKGTDFITGKSGVLTNLFDSFKKVIPTSSSVSKPVKTSDGIEIKAGMESTKGSVNYKKFIVPVLIVVGVYFGIRKLTK